MLARNIESERKRSRPLENRRRLGKNKLALGVILVIVFVIVIAGLYIFIFKNNEGNSNNGLSGNPIAIINTSMGIIRVELYEDKMPITTANFIKLANDGFYNGMIFHRIGDNFMIQTGGYLPDGTQKSSPYGNIQFETSDVKHVDGAISMASTGAKVGGSAQFFICDGAQSSLDGNYAAFGVTIEGIDVVRAIAAQPHSEGGDGTGKPTTDIVINSIIIENS
jgi:cyclophilin family peptidyl-prolyl cis-trans isomerase